jgi:hypothetical protein
MKTLLTLLLIFWTSAIFAQEKNCGFVYTPNPQEEKAIKNFLLQKRNTAKQAQTTETVYNIPVIFHIIHTNNPNDAVNKITNLQIREQIKVINQDFNRLNPDTIHTPTQFKNVAGKIAINFILAKIDSNNVILQEEGVVRHYNFTQSEWLKNEFDSLVKPSTIRNPYKYLNIWVVNDLKTDIGNVVGFAQFPDFSNLLGLQNIGGLSQTDGVIIEAQTFNLLASNEVTALPSLYNVGFGRTLTHEIGHFWGILHTFNTANHCEDDDFCEDTPNLKFRTSGCTPFTQNICTSLVMPQNYMDYTNDVCMNLFTKCQIERMKLVLEKCPRRKELTKSVVTSVREEYLAEQISIFPNPSNNNFNIKSENLTLKSLKIYSILGTEVFSNQQLTQNISIDIPHFPKGLYLLKIETERGIVTKKLIVE